MACKGNADKLRLKPVAGILKRIELKDLNSPRNLFNAVARLPCFESLSMNRKKQKTAKPH
ncbi:MAG: hypothetical protein V4543_00030 [Bacteroidota bacterium]